MANIDRFDNFGVEDMSKEAYAEKYAAVMASCICSECPSFVAGDPKTAYCFPLGGYSKVIKVEKGCICDSCPVSKEYELNHAHYCTRCSQVCQSYKTELGGGHE